MDDGIRTRPAEAGAIYSEDCAFSRSMVKNKGCITMAEK